MSSESLTLPVTRHISYHQLATLALAWWLTGWWTSCWVWNFCEIDFWDY